MQLQLFVFFGLEVRTCTVCVALILLIVGSSPRQLFGQQKERVTPAGTKLLVYTPSGYYAGTSNHPLLIFLHSENEIGNDLSLLTGKAQHQLPPGLIAQNKWNSKLPFLVVSPQLKPESSNRSTSQGWSPDYINEVIEYVRKNYRVDIYRIYITGAQIGATGAYAYASVYPEKVAALIPVSGNAETMDVCKLKDIPTWVFHGSSNHTIPVSEPVAHVKTIKQCAPQAIFFPRLTVLNARGHDVANELYDGSLGIDIYTWFLKFRKNNVTNKAPYVNAGPDRTILSSSGSHTIVGDFFDWDGTIKQIKWTQTAGPDVNFKETSSSLFTLQNPMAGEYEFQLAVTDNKGLVSSDRVRINVVDRMKNTPEVTGLVLIDGKTNREITSIFDGMVINKATLGVSEFNVRAYTSPGVTRVKFQINTDHVTRTVTGAGPYLLQKPSTSPEWEMTNGIYVICVTPYSASGPGPGSCYRFSVTSSSMYAHSLIHQTDDLITIKSIDDILISNMPRGNQWVLNGQDILGATGSVFKPSVPGEYYLRIVDRPVNNISNSVIKDAPSKANPNLAFEVVSYPSKEFLLISGEVVPSKAYYKLIRRGGELVQEGALREDFRIPLSSDIQKGEYVVMIRTKQGNQSVKVMLN
jgi:hypothetical protein